MTVEHAAHFDRAELSGPGHHRQRVVGGRHLHVAHRHAALDPITIASGASLPTALAKSFSRYADEVSDMSWPIAFMV